MQKDLEKLKIILDRYEQRRDKLIDQIAVEKVELNRRGLSHPTYHCRYFLICCSRALGGTKVRVGQAAGDNQGSKPES